MDYVIRVPNTNVGEEWFRFVNHELAMLERGPYDLVAVDFNYVSFLETDDFVILACLIESFFQNGARIVFQGGTAKFNHHLDNIYFKDYWREGFDREVFTLSRNRTTLCLWKICQSRIDSYSNYAKDYFSRVFINDKDLLPLSYNLVEVFNNIFDHSQAEISYVITQYFPQLHKLSFSVCDFGIGIPRSVNNFLVRNGNSPRDDAEALDLSLNIGFSVRSSSRNRGFGLDNIREFADSSNGSLTIVSNNGLLYKEAGCLTNIENKDFNFHGTLVKVEVDTNTFESIDIEDRIFEF